MSTIDRIYRCSLGLLTELYELTMACGCWKLGRADPEAVFLDHLREPKFTCDIDAVLEGTVVFP